MLLPKKRYKASAAKFRRLIEGLLDGKSRTCFEPWEIELLLDISDLKYTDISRHRRLLEEYLRDIGEEMKRGAKTPAKLSEYQDRRVRAGAASKKRTEANGA